MLTANQYTTEHAGTTSTGSLLSVALPFDAGLVRFDNRGTVPLRYTVASTQASTDDAELAAGAFIEVRTTTAKLGVMTTATSTDGTDHRAVRVRATGM